MDISVIGLLIVAIAMEVAREVCFKLAANKSDENARNGSYLLKLLYAPWIWAGFACWGTEIVVWIQVLAHVPLSIAFPLMSLCYCGMILASKYILKETITQRKLVGVVLITAGVALIGVQGVA